MRTFVALHVPDAERRALQQALEPLRQRDLPVRWTAHDALHLTLKFLGEIEPAQVAPIGAGIARVAAQHQSLELRLAGLGAFPSLRRANVLWIGVDADPRLRALQRDVETVLLGLGYPREPRPFRPHLTVARTRGGARAPDVSRLLDAFGYRSAAIVELLDLMRSHATPAGSRYEPLVQARLGQAEP